MSKKDKKDMILFESCLSLHYLIRVLKTPILFNMNFGHAYPRTVLPYGALASIDLDAATVTIEEPYFSK